MHSCRAGVRPRPAGKLKVAIKATWLRNAHVDADAMTEVGPRAGVAPWVLWSRAVGSGLR
jgi:hypothetical protein